MLQEFNWVSSVMQAILLLMVNELPIYLIYQAPGSNAIEVAEGITKQMED